MTTIHPIKVPLPFPVKWINCFYVRDSVPTLIDTGIHSDECLQALRSAIAATGDALEDLRRVIVTHGHVDHMGLAGEMARITGAEIFIHAWDESKTTVVDPEHVSETRRKYALFLQEAGVTDATASELVDLVVTRLESLCLPMPHVTALHGDEVFRFDDLDLTVVHAPGHTPGSVCLFDARRGHLYSGDSLIEELTFSPATDTDGTDNGRVYQSLTECKHTWNRLSELNVRKVFPGHGRAYSNLRERIQQLRAFHEHRRCEILSVLETRRSAQGSQSGFTRLELARLLFATMKEIEVYYRITAVRAHLEVLEAEGLVSSTAGDSGLVYRLCRG